MLKSLSAYQVTFEHEFIALVMTLDGLRHPLLAALPFEPILPFNEFKISKAEFLNAREDMLERMLSACPSSYSV